MIEGDPDEHLDLYFRQCSIVMTAVDLAVMGAALANGGVNPRTGERAIAAEHVRDVLSVMTSCGMYDYAGEWELRVGLPAKSGVGGGIMAVLPGQLGIGVFSPRLDAHGNSLRGLRICEDLSRSLKLHPLQHRGSARTALRRHYTGAEIRSRRVRRAAARALLDELGVDISVYELQGDLYFGNFERVVRAVLADTRASRFILDCRRVAAADNVSATLLSGLCRALGEAGKRVLIAGADDALKSAFVLHASAYAPDVDSALEMFEDEMLQDANITQYDPAPPIPLRVFSLLREFEPDEIGILEGYLERRVYAAGQVIIREGAPAEAFYFIEEGLVEIRVAGAMGGGFVRLGTVEAGNVVGEMALLGGGARTAEVAAGSRASMLILTADSFAALGRAHPRLESKLLAAIGRSLAGRLRRANIEIGALTR